MTSTALIVIDVQDSFLQRDSWKHSSNPDIAVEVGRLVDHARANGDHVAWVLHSEPGTDTVFDPASGHVRYQYGLAPIEGEIEVRKTSHNAFTTTNLLQQFTERGIREIVICGIRTEQCCETTARLASDLGYQVTFVIDGTATEPIAHRDLPEDAPIEEVLADPRTLLPAAIIERTEYALAGRFATIATVAEVLAGASGDAV
jgi:nicotinamidase-related amidase